MVSIVSRMLVLFGEVKLFGRKKKKKDEKKDLLGFKSLSDILFEYAEAPAEKSLVAA